MNIVIPLCGKGVRFRDFYTQPKPLIKIFDKEMIFYVLDNLNFKENDKVFIILHNDLSELKHVVYNKYKNITFIMLNTHTRGAAETIYKGLETILKNYDYNKKTILLDCDTFYTDDILQICRDEDNNCVFYTHNTEEKPIYSYIQLEGDKITKIVEKQKISDNANTGCYYFNDINQLHDYAKYVVDNNIIFSNEMYTSCIIHTMLNNSIEFKGVKLDRIFSLGTPLAVNEYKNNTYAFLFDLDGTIVLTDHIYKKVWTIILKEYNIEYTDEIYFKYIKGFNDNYVCSKLLHNANCNKISLQKDSLFKDFIKEIKVIAGFHYFIRLIKKSGYKICIVSNCNRLIAETILEEIKINNLIDHLIIGNECTKPKPYPEPYLKAMNQLSIENDKCIIFEDSNTGILSGLSANPKCMVGINNIENNNHDVNYNQCNFVVNDYNQLNLNELLEFNLNHIKALKENIVNSIYNDMKVTVDDIEISNIKLKGGFISDVISLNINKNNKPLECVVKIKNPNKTPLQIMADKLNLYERENYFYESLSKYIPIKFPKYYGLIKDKNYENIGVILENMFKRDEEFILNLDLNKVNIETSLKIIDSLAKLHSKFWNINLCNSFKELKKNNDELFKPCWGDFIRSKIDIFVDKWNNIFPNNFIENMKKIASNFEEIQDQLSDTNLTLIHGDVKSPNIFYLQPTNEPFFIDWQYIANGKGVQDLVFFMIESFESNKIDVYGNLFKEYYYVKLLEYGVVNYTYENYEKDFRNAVLYFPVFVGIWFGTTPSEDLIDKNFPYFYLLKLSYFMKRFNIEF